jgi:hypothetical protein
MESTPTSVSANASDVGLIVQGTLIFLSALVGIFGFIVKGRIEAKQRVKEKDLQHQQHLRELRLERIHNQLSTFLGPASIHAMEMWSAFWSVVPAKLDKLANGRVNAYFQDIGFSFQTFIQAKYCEMESWVGFEVEKEMTEAPSSAIAVLYRKFMKRIVKTCAVPLANLIKQHGGYLSQFPSEEEFKKRFPCSAKDGWLRNSYYLSFTNWTDEFVQIIDEEWETNDFSNMFPHLSKFPCQITPWILSQVTELREQQVKLGSANHKVSNWEDERKENYKDTEYVTANE